MKGRPWTAEETKLLRYWHKEGMWRSEMALLLDRTETAIKQRITVLGLGGRRLWEPEEIELVYDEYLTTPAAELAARLDRPLTSVYQMAAKLGLAESKHVPEELLELIRVRQAEDYCDSEIAAEWNTAHPGLTFNRRTIAEKRRDLGLPNNANGPRHRRRVAAKTREQLDKAGLTSLAEVRVEAFKRFAREHGWPEDLRPRAVQILDALYVHGPQTRKQLAERIGMRTDYQGEHAQRKVLKSNDAEGSYLAHLMARGLVVALGRRVKYGPGRGQRVFLYAIPLHVRRNLPHASETTQQPVAQHRQSASRARRADRAAPPAQRVGRRHQRAGHGRHRQRDDRAG